MPQIIIETVIDAPAAVCFGLVRDERVRSVGSTASGTGDVELGQIVRFEDTFFGLRQTLSVKVVEFEPGRRFVDEMIDGGFRSFRHTHEFVDTGVKTLMRDIVEWTSPLGILGRAADRLLLKRHLRKLATRRNSKLKAIAESGG